MLKCSKEPLGVFTKMLTLVLQSFPNYSKQYLDKTTKWTLNAIQCPILSRQPTQNPRVILVFA
ncbi:MAG: hypothetical protein ACJAVV_001645 [Alphaproteobacteria bacterium]|jgi:hypothetical protein